MRSDKKVYYITVSDIQDVAEQDLDRKLNETELKKVIDKMCDYINWSDGISFAIEELDLKPKE